MINPKFLHDLEEQLVHLEAGQGFLSDLEYTSALAETRAEIARLKDINRQVTIALNEGADYEI